MQLLPHQYYHIYNRSNNDEIAFKEPENYGYFLRKFQHYLGNDLAVIAYCLMPTHFHFLVYVKSQDTERTRNSVGVLLSSYTKAINKRHNRHGSLFQLHTKARCIDDERYLITVVTYVHQNPVRAGFVKRLEDWDFSSYLDYLGRDGLELGDGDRLVPDTHKVLSCFSSAQEFREYSNTLLHSVDKRYWV
jgi:REP element-mobilizing transposase RayT